MKIKKTLKDLILNFTPPLILTFIKNNFLSHGWHGSYKTWNEAKSKTTGYDNELILNKVKNSLLKVKTGLNVYERDSVLFDKIYYSWPLLTGIMMAAAKSNGRISILDFGGSLGSSYFQNKKFLNYFDNVIWSIIEQKHFVYIGKQEFEDERLKFYLNIDDCIKEQSPNILILSSVLQYLEQPYDYLNNMFQQLKTDFVIIDRTPFLSEEERIAIQIVPSEIYKASYPCHIFNYEKLNKFFGENGYRLIEEFEAVDGKKSNFTFKGLIYISDRTYA